MTDLTNLGKGDKYDLSPVVTAAFRVMIEGKPAPDLNWLREQIVEEGIITDPEVLERCVVDLPEMIESLGGLFRMLVQMGMPKADVLEGVCKGSCFWVDDRVKHMHSDFTGGADVSTVRVVSADGKRSATMPFPKSDKEDSE